MISLVIYDSIFGNTAKVAQTMSAALQTSALPISQVTLDMLHGLDLLIVGSPTRSFRPTPSISRFLKSLPQDQLAGIQVTAFDTRIWLNTIDSAVFRFLVDKSGYAANTMASMLKKKGGTLAVPPEGFLVTGEQGPLKNGELERAAEWIRRFPCLEIHG
ncbi:MAG TPA: nitric oxide synthase [Anaerolineae bacterium]|nr:nitric oxide synthase [Anaerolineae bacterium]